MFVPNVQIGGGVDLSDFITDITQVTVQVKSNALPEMLREVRYRIVIHPEESYYRVCVDYYLPWILSPAVGQG